MPHNIFGSSYPPGCSGTPYDDDHPCVICCEEADNCICPECPVCGAQGDPKCEVDHGLVIPKSTKAHGDLIRQSWADLAALEAEAENMAKEIPSGLMLDDEPPERPTND